MIFTFNTVDSPEQTADMICNTVRAIGGTVKQKQVNLIEAKWRSPELYTVLPTKYSFIIGQDAVRVMCGNGQMALITTDMGKGGGVIRVWMLFVEKLIAMYPDKDFGLSGRPIVLNKIKFLTNGIEQKMNATSVTNEHMLIPDVTYTMGKTQSQFSKTILATARYSNGLIAEGQIAKGSRDYNIIMANINEYTKE